MHDMSDTEGFKKGSSKFCLHRVHVNKASRPAEFNVSVEPWQNIPEAKATGSMRRSKSATKLCTHLVSSHNPSLIGKRLIIQLD